jgi:hypothetical protein
LQSYWNGALIHCPNRIFEARNDSGRVRKRGYPAQQPCPIRRTPHEFPRLLQAGNIFAVQVLLIQFSPVDTGWAFPTRRQIMNSKAKRIIMVALLAYSIPLPTMMTASLAQDVPGIEICTRERQIDRRIGCLQSNIEFLQQLITRQTLDAQQKLGAANRDIAALKESLAGATREIGTLKESLAGAGRDIAALRESVAAAQAKINESQKAPPTRSPSR